MERGLPKLSQLSIPTPSDSRPVTTHLFSDTSPRLLTMTNFLSIDSLVENCVTNRDLAYAIKLLSLCFKALIAYMSSYFIHHVLVLENAYFNSVINFMIFESLFSNTCFDLFFAPKKKLEL